MNNPTEPPKSVQLKLIVPNALSGERADRALPIMAEAAGHTLSRRQVKRLMDAGSVRVDGRPLRVASRPLQEGYRVIVELGPPPPEAPKHLVTPDQVLFQDTHILVLNKPPRLPSQATRDLSRDHLFAAAQRWMAAGSASDAGAQPNEDYVALHHRLDRDTSGVMIFGIHRDANRGLSAAFQDRTANKQYLAAVAGAELEIGHTRTFDQPIGPLGKVRGRVKQGVGSDDAKSALTEMTVVAKNASGSLAWVRCEPKTGRTHQIRVHLAHAGLPIVGDRFYGGVGDVDGERVPRCLLHAQRLSLPHPISQEIVSFEASTPADESHWWTA